MLRAGEWKATSDGTWQKSWICSRDKAPVLGRGEEDGEYSPHHSELTCPPAIRKLCFPVHPPSPYPMHSHARPEAACHPRGLASPFAGSQPPQGLSLPWPACPLEGLHPCGAAPSTAGPLEKDCSPEKLEQAQPGCAIPASILRQSCQSSCPGEEPLGCSAAQLATPTLKGCCTPVEHLPSTTSHLKEPHSPKTAEQDLPGHVKSASTSV